MSMIILDEEPKTAAPAYNTKIADAINRLYRKGANFHLTQMLSKLKATEIANVLSSFPEHKANALFALMNNPQQAAQVLTEMAPPLKKYILAHCDIEQAVAVLESLPADLRNHSIGELDEETGERLRNALAQVPESESDELQQFKNDTAGSLMTADFFSLPETTTTAEAIHAVQSLTSHDSVFYIYMVDEQKRLTGVCSIRRLILGEPDKPLKDFTQSRLLKVHVDTPQGEVANQVSRYRLLAMPVVDGDGVLVGQITIDDLVHVIQDENTGSLLKMAGIDPKNTDVLGQSPFQIFRARVPWLITAFVAYLLVSAILDGFEETLAAVVQLAFFFPIVIGMSGNAGSQTGAVVVRGLALGTIHNAHFFKLLFKELAANLVQGALYGVFLAVASYAIFQNPKLSLTLGPAMALSITCAAAIALSLPFFFKKIGADPAIAAGPLALAFIDMVGSTNYLVIAYLVFDI